MREIFVSATTAEDTLKFGQSMGNFLKPGDLLLLTGALGAGKTTLVQGIGRALGTENIPCSPSYTLLREHRGKKATLLHGDLYRLPQNTMPNLGIIERLEEGAIACLEWADRMQIMPEARLYIHMENHEKGRKITIKSDDHSLLKKLGKIL